jgi:hypothetical protein
MFALAPTPNPAVEGTGRIKLRQSPDLEPWAFSTRTTWHARSTGKPFHIQVEPDTFSLASTNHSHPSKIAIPFTCWHDEAIHGTARRILM